MDIRPSSKCGDKRNTASAINKSEKKKEKNQKKLEPFLFFRFRTLFFTKKKRGDGKDGGKHVPCEAVKLS
jgi:hypothetical protein